MDDGTVLGCAFPALVVVRGEDAVSIQDSGLHISEGLYPPWGEGRTVAWSTLSVGQGRRLVLSERRCVALNSPQDTGGVTQRKVMLCCHMGR